MIELENRKILDDGTVVLAEAGAVEILYQGLDLTDFQIEPCEDAKLFNVSNRMLDAGMGNLDMGIGPRYDGISWYGIWLTPEQYVSIDIGEFCLSLCDTDEERDRVRHEMRLFEERDMLPVLRHLIYMVTDLRSRDVMWGVGRGSSVSSFVLHLIGINRINPIKFGLDVSEFLK